MTQDMETLLKPSNLMELVTKTKYYFAHKFKHTSGRASFAVFTIITVLVTTLSMAELPVQFNTNPEFATFSGDIIATLLFTAFLFFTAIGFTLLALLFYTFIIDIFLKIQGVRTSFTETLKIYLAAYLPLYIGIIPIVALSALVNVLALINPVFMLAGVITCIGYIALIPLIIWHYYAVAVGIKYTYKTSTSQAVLAAIMPVVVVVGIYLLLICACLGIITLALAA